MLGDILGSLAVDIQAMCLLRDIGLLVVGIQDKAPALRSLDSQVREREPIKLPNSGQQLGLQASRAWLNADDPDR